MAFNKITDQDTAGLGVTGLADVPGLSTEDMQEQFDEFPRYLVTRLNQLIDELMAEAAAEFIGSKDGNVQADIDTLKAQVAAKVEESAFEALNAEVQKKANAADVIVKNSTEPYTPTDQYDPATKGYVDGKLVEIGAGDMAKSVYDPTGRGSDIFAAVDEAKNAADAAGEAAAGAQTTADGAMPKNGGNFSGIAYASWENTDTPCLRNIEVKDAAGMVRQSTNLMVFLRK